MTAAYETVVLVTRQTELDELVARFATESQARFYLEQAGHEFDSIKASHDSYYEVVGRIRSAIPRVVKFQVIDRLSLPHFTFGEADLVLTVGQDGLVSNTAKYLTGQPILAINPNPYLYDGVLLPFDSDNFETGLLDCLTGRTDIRQVTMAQATLADGQTLLAFNDFFVGATSHVSARYRIEHEDQQETQSSSGIIVSTGAGSTGWLQSVYAGASGIVEALGGRIIPPPNGGRLQWDARQLVFSVREPFPSNVTGTSIVYGTITPDSPLSITSHMGRNGFIFSDGIEADYLDFNRGASATISIAPGGANLVTP